MDEELLSLCSARVSRPRRNAERAEL